MGGSIGCEAVERESEKNVLKFGAFPAQYWFC